MKQVKKRQPWFKWYCDNWLGEPRLKMVSRAARSLWVDMLNLMHQAEPGGFLIVANVPLKTPELVAKATGDSIEEIAPLFRELEVAGLFSRVGDRVMPEDVAALIPSNVEQGTILSRKMLRDITKAEVDRANGKRGGNPDLKPTDNEGVNPRDKGGDKAQRPEARGQSSVLRTDASASKPKGALEETQHPSKPSLTDKDWLWRDGLTWLSNSTGKPEQRARSQMGKWLRDAKEDAAMLRSVFEAAQAENVFEPIAWITAAIKTRVQQAAPFEPTDDHGWRKRFKAL